MLKDLWEVISRKLHVAFFTNMNLTTTREMHISFLAVDSAGVFFPTKYLKTIEIFIGYFGSL